MIIGIVYIYEAPDTESEITTNICGLFHRSILKQRDHWTMKTQDSSCNSDCIRWTSRKYNILRDSIRRTQRKYILRDSDDIRPSP